MSISQFIRACRRAKDVVPVSSERNLTHLLINKLRGRALAAVEDEPCDNVTELINLLNNAFGTQKTIDQYKGELSIIYLKPDEHILDYISRVKDLRPSIMDAGRREYKNNEKYENEIDNLTARSFCEGLPLEYRLQLQSEHYMKPFEAFAAAKFISKRLELDKVRYGRENQNQTSSHTRFNNQSSVSTFNRSGNNNNNSTMSKNVPRPNYNNDSNYNNNVATYRNPTKPNYNFSLGHHENNYNKICNFCKFKRHICI
jgi:hypothetical protein